jgi:D-alanyl-D-alanine carboxypeptidase (penicillin-binding protein 5/6)
MSLFQRTTRAFALAVLALSLASCDPSATSSELGGRLRPAYRGNETVVPTTRAFAIVDMDTGYLLDYRNLNEKVQVGSLTKIATAIVTQNWMDQTRTSAATQVAIPQSAFAYGGANPLGLQPGDTMTIRDLLYAALMNSDNISAFALAEFVGGALVQGGYGAGSPQETFVAQMNTLAQQLGMTDTFFTNAAGLDSIGGREPYSTASDMARLTRSAIVKPSFRFAVSQVSREVTISRGGQTFAYTLRNTNDLLGRGNIDGVKTGRTRLAGDCVILSEERPPKTWQEGETFYRINRRLIVVVLGSNNRFVDGEQLINYGWGVHESWMQGSRHMEEGRKL